MIILPNKSHGEIIRVFIGIFSTALRNNISRFSKYMRVFLIYIENLEKNDSPKWVSFNLECGQITSNALWK